MIRATSWLCSIHEQFKIFNLWIIQESWVYEHISGIPNFINSPISYLWTHYCPIPCSWIFMIIRLEGGAVCRSAVGSSESLRLDIDITKHIAKLWTSNHLITGHFGLIQRFIIIISPSPALTCCDAVWQVIVYRQSSWPRTHTRLVSSHHGLLAVKYWLPLVIQTQYCIIFVVAYTSVTCLEQVYNWWWNWCYDWCLQIPAHRCKNSSSYHSVIFCIMYIVWISVD